MANKLIPEELDALIQQYLTDGVLTDKERQVIIKKAEGLGLDRDEIDLYLDAEVQKIDQATDAAVRKQKGKSCPFCGGNVPMLADKCPHCDGLITAEASEELQEIFDNLEEALVNLKSSYQIEKSKATIERYVRKAKMYYGSNPKIQKLLAEIEEETVNAAKKNTVFRIINNWRMMCVICAGIAVVSLVIGLLFDSKGLVAIGLWSILAACFIFTFGKEQEEKEERKRKREAEKKKKEKAESEKNI